MSEGTKKTETLKVWSCDKCAFTMDAMHTEVTGGYSYACPACNELSVQARVQLLEKELEEALSREYASQQQVKELHNKLLEYGEHKAGCPEGMECNCGWSGVIAAALDLPAIPVGEEAEYLPAAMKKVCEVKEYLCRSCMHMHRINSKIGKAHAGLMHINYRPQPETQAVCPCTIPRMNKMCFACNDIRPIHSRKCTTPGCLGSGTLTPEETKC